MRNAFLFLFLTIIKINFLLGETDPQIPYERFISLGNCCVTRTQINHHLSVQFNQPAYIFGGGQLFDWLVIHDYHKMADAIDNHLVDLLEKSDLEPTLRWGNVYIKNLKYQMTWNHLFSRPYGNFTMYDILEQEYAIKKQKIDYLVQKFKDLSNYRTLYIIGYPFISPGRLGTEEPDLNTLLHLRSALENIRGNNNFSLLLCALEKNTEDFENIYIRQIISGPNDVDYIGNHQSWHNMFQEFPFSLEKSEVDGNTWADQQNW